MGCFFSADDVAQLQAGRGEVSKQFRDLRERFYKRTYKTDRGREYALHGFCRRLNELKRAIDFVFDLLPPELDQIPDTDEVVAAGMLIQSFFVNAWGCLDNLAWTWVFETDLRNENGTELQPRQVGLSESYGYVRKSFTRPFRKYLRTRRKWFHHLAEFRDALAHRIPLYIPPYIVSERDIPRHNELDNECIQAMVQGDTEAYDRLRSEQKALGTFRPWMTHSRTEKSPVAVFHWQLLQDYVTIDEFGHEMLDELARFDELASREKRTKSPLQRVWDWITSIYCRFR